MEEFVKKYFGEFIAAMVAGFAAWFYKRKFSKAQVEGLILQNIEKVTNMYSKAMDELEKQHKKQIDYLNGQIKELKQRLSEIENKHKVCEEKNRELELKIKDLTKRFKVK